MAEIYSADYLARRQREADEAIARVKRNELENERDEERLAIMADGPVVALGPKPGIAHAWPTTGEIVDGLGKRGPRHPTGLAPLDKICRGGIHAGKLVFVGGAPGSMKTGICSELAHTLARHGVPVAFLAADEEPDDAVIRVGQHIGLDRDELEEGSPIALKNLRAHVDSIPLYFRDGEKPGATIAGVAADLRQRHPTGPAVLFVDSVQTARAATATTGEGRRAEIDAVVAELKAVAKRHGLIVFATTELARGSYRSKRPEDNVDDLAAAKESGAIEYAAHVLMVLHSLPNRGVRVNIAKNRIGDKGAFGLRMDPIRATFLPFRLEDDEDAVPTSSGTGDLDAIVLAAIHEGPGQSGGALAKSVGKNRESVLGAVRRLVAAGRVLSLGPRPDRPEYWPRSEGAVPTSSGTAPVQFPSSTRSGTERGTGTAHGNGSERSNANSDVGIGNTDSGPQEDQSRR